ncbi:TetR family transcriptional regulator [Actinocrinis puniceicyclus]|uniref:TetR family transcriptional regulator n=1 Tax=Actinocrinis puniceicyclus TaxID=977794 RepID=A0A8J8BEZ9_9ACTN|nr:TetR family transcriptional regulator [Actinocrinis puniceicyclus]MBS2965676.1 TetR family transcriptional regulator [Actinocrinis puniceicyclus]
MRDAPGEVTGDPADTAGSGGGVRQARKLRTRQALLAAALRLLERQSLSSLGLREVARETGIAPAAFYRHFPDITALGVALVEESFGSLRAMVREIRVQDGDVDGMIARSVDLIAHHVHEHPAHFRFLARERHGGVEAVRTAIRAELDGFVRDLVVDLSRQPASAGWPTGEVRILAELYVNLTILTATAILDAAAGAHRDEQAILEAARMQLRLIALGRRHWRDGD